MLGRQRQDNPWHSMTSHLPTQRTLVPGETLSQTHSGRSLRNDSSGCPLSTHTSTHTYTPMFCLCEWKSSICMISYILPSNNLLFPHLPSSATRMSNTWSMFTLKLKLEWGQRVTWAKIQSQPLHVNQFLDSKPEKKWKTQHKLEESFTTNLNYSS